jgi:hypothetical protein
LLWFPSLFHVCWIPFWVTHFEWVGNRLMMKQEEVVGASDLCASSSSG